MRKILFVFALCFALLSSTYAQQAVTGTVTGEDGVTLPGVSVVQKGTSNGTITDIDGKYSIAVPADATLQFSFVGMEAQEVAVNGRSTVNVTLITSTVGLDEVVVTALGIEREKKSLGYAVQEVDGSQLSEVKTTSIANALAGKVAGVEFAKSGSGLGGSTRITIRGASSLSDNNQPLWVVDGIPIDDSQQKTGSGEWGGVDGAGAASQLNPDDIESISVLKGASASALYGSRAANGVILVTTKKGQAGAMRVNFNSAFIVESVTDHYEFQDMYGQGQGGVYDGSSKLSYGPLMEGQMVENWREGRSSYPLQSQGDRVKDFYETGTSFTNNLSISGGNEMATVRLSIMDSRNKGITPRHELDRQSVDLNTTLSPGKDLKFNAKVNFIREMNNHRPYMGEYGTMMQMVFMPRSIRLVDLQPAINEDGQQEIYGGATSTYSNPYFQTEYGRNDESERHRVISILGAEWKITDWLTWSMKGGIDYYRDSEEDFGHQDNLGTGGFYSVREKHLREINVDGLLKFQKDITSDLNLTLSAGASLMNRKSESLYNKANTLIVQGLYALSNGESFEHSEEFSKKEIQSVYGFGNIAYRNWAYLDFTARNDWSSTLPSDNWSFFYPSVSASIVVSDMLKDFDTELPSWISFAKIRGSVAEVGNDTDPYRLMSTYELKTDMDLELIYASKPGALPFSDLKPEIQNSKEIGLDLRFLHNRLGVDFAWYKTSTENQILSVGIPSTSGFKTRWINAGQIDNKGIELSINAVPVKTDDLTWDLNFNYGKNKNEVVELSPEYGIERFELGGTRMLKVYAFEGGEYGEIHGKKFYRDEATGKVLVNSDGLPLHTNSNEKIGSINPDWVGSLRNTLKYKSLTLSALVDIKKGGDLVSITDAHGAQVGTGANTIEGRNGDLVVDGIVGEIVDGKPVSSGQANTKAISAESYWSNLGGAYGVAEAFLYDAGFVKLREVSLSYDMPSNWFKNSFISSMRASLIGRDLFFIYRDTPGTDPQGSNGRKDEQQAYEISSLPVTSSFGVNLNITF